MSAYPCYPLLTRYDISQGNHEHWPGIMARFVESFSGPVIICGDLVGPGRPTVGHVVSVEKRGEDLWGEIRWIGDPPSSTKHVKMNWSFGPGPDRVSLSSGFLDHWPHRTAWEDEEDDDLERGLRLGEDNVDDEETWP